jgi:transcriptional regulator with XRE-family HTH domain
MRKGLSLVELARRMKVSRPTVWSWETGKSTPRRSKSEALLEALGVPEDELFGPSALSQYSSSKAETSGRSETLRNTIHEAKERIADAIGTSAEKVTVIIEV